jgi:hypothetical protein
MTDRVCAHTSCDDCTACPVEDNLITKNDDVIMREWIEKTEKRLKKLELSIARAGARYK